MILKFMITTNIFFFDLKSTKLIVGFSGQIVWSMIHVLSMKSRPFKFIVNLFLFEVLCDYAWRVSWEYNVLNIILFNGYWFTCDIHVHNVHILCWSVVFHWHILYFSVQCCVPHRWECVYWGSHREWKDNLWGVCHPEDVLTEPRWALCVCNPTRASGTTGKTP